MCAINGFTWSDPVLINKMNDALAHRGPDDEGVFVNNQVSLGHRRLSIQDLSSSGHQPMGDEEKGIWIVFNGEIYNFKEIRTELVKKGYVFKSGSDTEVILRAYEEWGINCVERFNGMWGLALYDHNLEILFLSRDRFGVKPLYYHLSEKGLIFSSEVKGILESNIKREPNDRIVFEYLAFGYVDHTEETFFSGIYKLIPGENLIYDLRNKKAKKVKWYDYDARVKKLRKKVQLWSTEEKIEKIKDLFKSGIEYRMISDTPVGSCLSGGIDSSAIVYNMKGGEIKTFSMVYPGQEKDESKYIKEVVEDTEVKSLTTTPAKKELMEDLQDLIRTQEEPFRSTSIYGQYRVMKLAHENGMKVLLDGQGADELFAGYFTYFKYYFWELGLKGRVWEAREYYRGLGDLITFPMAIVLSKIGLGSVVSWYLKPRYLKNFKTNCNILDNRGFELESSLKSDLLQYSVPQLLRYEDKNSMRWSIESRTPFLDYRFVELAGALDVRDKLRDGVSKWIFREAMRGVVGEEILDRKDKVGFEIPDWDIEELIKEVGNRKYWDVGRVRGIEDFEKLWRVVNVEMWLRGFIDK